MARALMQTMHVRDALDQFGTSTRQSVSLPGLEITLYNIRTLESHDTLLAPTDAFQIGYIFEGVAPDKQGCFPETKNAERLARLGDLFLIPPDTPFRTVCGPIQTHGLQCFLAKSRFEQLWEASFDSWTRDQFEASIDVRDPQIHRLMRQLVREMTGTAKARELAIEYLVSLTLIQVGRHLADRRSSQGTLPAWQIKRVREMVREQCHTPCTVQDIAQACGISASHLMRAYKKSTGQTIGKLLEEVRIEHARAMLRDGVDSIGEIAAALGYSSQPHFSAAFCRAMGMAPRRYRQLMATEPSRPALATVN
ncbi:MAG: helix-turn-helix domain-containing protein [Sphingobium sp.]